ncbi:MAG: amidase domain-containing protein, partial [Clostridium sp.]
MKFKFITILLIALLIFNILPISQCFALEDESNTTKIDYSSEEVKKEFKDLTENLFAQRNAAIVSNDTELLKEFYNLNIKVSLWAYESEAKKTQYLINWSEKQAVKFKDIKSIVRIRKVAEKEPDLYGVICDVATDFNYYYTDSPDIINHFRLGTNHYLNLKKIDDKYIITKEWYTDAFAD